MKLVSCLCLTFNRFPAYGHLLQECIESFERQDYTAKELIIINDAPDQELICDAPQVTIINLPRRCSSLGEKFNLAATQAKGDILMNWDDDDIVLPHRISWSLDKLGNEDYYNSQRYWYLAGGKIHHNHSMGVCHGSGVFTRRAFDLVGGYPHVSGAQDLEMDVLFRTHPKIKTVQHTPPTPRDWYYIYRFGHQPVHLSGRAPHDEWYKTIGTLGTVRGKFKIEPKWYEDYPKLIKDYLDENGL
jgi:glycosyltransferase involved in cell wall biosynthesis